MWMDVALHPVGSATLTGIRGRAGDPWDIIEGMFGIVTEEKRPSLAILRSLLSNGTLTVSWPAWQTIAAKRINTNECFSIYISSFS